MTRLILLSLALFSFCCTHAAIVDTAMIYSNAMKKEIKCIVIRPDTPEKLPVVYLLHGYSGSATDWIKKVPAIQQYADDFHLMIVCPDGDYSSWYFDSPVDAKMRYETHVSQEVPAYIDQHYATIRDKKARAITGLSMGGHGGLYIGFRHPDQFGACGSMSGGVDLRSSRNRFDIIKRIGDTIQHADNWKNYSVIGLIERKIPDSIRILIDCGVDDFFYPDNVALHRKMMENKIPHEYIERPGKHDWNYWSNAVIYQLFFFRQYFDGK